MGEDKGLGREGEGNRERGWDQDRGKRKGMEDGF